MPQIYRLLTGPDTSEFCHKVTNALSQGWQLYGDPALNFDQKTGMMICAQAVTKQTEAKYDPKQKLSEY